MPKTKRVNSKKPTRRLPQVTGFNFAQIVRSSWSKTVQPLRGAKVPAEIRRLPLARNLTAGTAGLLGILAIGAILLFFFGNNLVHAWQEKTSAALVNGEVISKGDLERRLIQSYGDDTVQKLVDETLVIQEGAKEKVTVSTAEINSELAQVEKDIAPTKLDDALAARKMSRADLERQIEIKILIEKMLGTGTTPSDKDITDYFNANRDALAQSAGKASADLTEADVRSNIISTLQQQAISSKYQGWIEGLRAQSKIETFVNP